MSAPNLRRPASDKLRFLAQVVRAEADLLSLTDGRIFAQPMNEQRAASLRQDVDLGERVDAFVARFGRLQDTLADKLLPEVLAWPGLASPSARRSTTSRGRSASAGSAMGKRGSTPANCATA